MAKQVSGVCATLPLELTVSSSAWFPNRNVPSLTTHCSLPGQSPACHCSIVSGNHEGISIWSSTSEACVAAGYWGQVRRARSSYPLPLYPWHKLDWHTTTTARNGGSHSR